MQEIGRFKITRKLGSGAQGSVYLCVDPHLQRKVAIKVLDRSLFGDGQQEKGFLREARAISRIQHPNIVSIFDTGKVGSRPYLVFEYVDGQLLSDWLAANPVSLTEALPIFTAILLGVAEVHGEGMVHRDLKPANIMLTADLTPKIMDFGLARIMDKRSQADSVRAGTPRYMAPEYITDGVIGPQTDVFALGAILYELLTGRRAFDAENQQAVLQKIIQEPIALPSTHNPEINHRLEAIVQKALEKNPNDRYANADDLLQALMEYRQGADGDEGGLAKKQPGKQGTVDFLIRRMQHKSDFPALSESIRTLNHLAASEEQDTAQLASVLIRDFALTNRILRVVNSAYYSRFAGKIGTISRAIVVLGINTIRTIAASLIFFEHLHNKTQAVQLKDRIAAAVFSAALARQAATDGGVEHEEEGFLCGMLHNLGQVLVVYYLHSESEEINRLVKQEGVEQEQAERRVLGMTYQEMGTEVARQWNFPETIVHGMTKVDPAKPGDLKRKSVKLRLIANFSNEAVEVIGDLNGDDRAPVKTLLKRYRMGLAISDKRFTAMVDNARNEFKELSSLGNSHNSTFMQRLTAQPVGASQAKPKPTHDQDLTQTLALDVFSEAVFDAVEGETEPPQTPEMILTEGLQEVSAMLLDDRVNLNQLVNVVLETIYRAMSFNRVVLCLLDGVKKHYVARLGFGKDIEQFMPAFKFSRNYSPDVFHAALKNGADIYISNAGDASIVKDIPVWHKKISQANAFAVFPLVIKESPVGLIYADYDHPEGAKLVGKSLNLIKALRNQVILALRARA
ncbi:MAG: HDOD domain-containing protein [Chromatiales bacterium]|nr:HDOD domain-containing protein [Chromatiales bacterium]